MRPVSLREYQQFQYVFHLETERGVIDFWIYPEDQTRRKMIFLSIMNPDDIGVVRQTASLRRAAVSWDTQIIMAVLGIKPKDLNWRIQ